MMKHEKGAQYVEKSNETQNFQAKSEKENDSSMYDGGHAL